MSLTPEFELARGWAGGDAAKSQMRCVPARLATRAVAFEYNIALGAGTQRVRHFIALVAVAFAAILPSAFAEDVNHVDSIQAVGSNVEITLSSSRKFPARAMRPVLAIGSQRFELSRYPDDGQMGTLIFILTASEFQALTDGSAMSVDYGDGAEPGSPWGPWSFGALDKSLLQ
jgi:hypothetical protein